MQISYHGVRLENPLKEGFYLAILLSKVLWRGIRFRQSIGRSNYYHPGLLKTTPDLARFSSYTLDPWVDSLGTMDWLASNRSTAATLQGSAVKNIPIRDFDIIN